MSNEMRVKWMVFVNEVHHNAWLERFDELRLADVGKKRLEVN